MRVAPTGDDIIYKHMSFRKKYTLANERYCRSFGGKKKKKFPIREGAELFSCHKKFALSLYAYSNRS